MKNTTKRQKIKNDSIKRPVNKNLEQKIKRVWWQQHWIHVFIIGLITTIVHSSGIHNELVRWDDNHYIYENKLVTSTNCTHDAIFTTSVYGTYAPLVIESYIWLDCKLHGGLHQTSRTYATYTEGNTVLNNEETHDGTWFHIDNLIIHVISTILLFFIFFALTHETIIAILVALLFGIHPMGVESVAWASERKDVLYVCFYFIALICYLVYRKKNKKIFFILTCLAFTASCLSKGEAVTLPLVLLLIDYLQEQKVTWKVVTEKIIFLGIALAFGLVAYFAQKNVGSIHDEMKSYSIGYRVVLACYGIILYLIKVVSPNWPIQLSVFYPYPEKSALLCGSILILPLLGLYYWKFWHNKKMVFGMSFFLLTIIWVLQFIPVGSAIVADRYSYLPYVGLFYLCAIGILFLWKRMRGNSLVKIVFCVSLSWYFFELGRTTYARTKIWHDSKSVYTDILKTNKNNISVLVDLGYLYTRENKMDSALFCLDTVIEYQPKSTNAYVTRANVYLTLIRANLQNVNEKNLVLAKEDCENAILFDPKCTQAYEMLGEVYYFYGNTDSALQNYQRALTLGTIDSSVDFIMMGKIYEKRGVIDSVVIMNTKSIVVSPTQATAYANRGDAERKLGQVDKALNDLTVAINMQPNIGSRYLWRSWAYYEKKEFCNAKQDMYTAMNEGAEVPTDYQVMLNAIKCP